MECSEHEERIDHRSHVERGLDEQPTVHEGVAARAMEKKGIVSDRCELNRQIKADNALLRALKAQVQKLTNLVKEGVAAIAEAMESLRQKMIIFRYQLRHIGAGKEQIGKTLDTVRPDLERYSMIVGKIKAKFKERKVLLAEKKATLPLQVFRHRELSQKIAAITEDLEELQSEKSFLFNSFQSSGDTNMKVVRERIASMEASLQRLNQQNEKYSAELSAALTEYAMLVEQTKGVDPAELVATRQIIRPDKEHDAIQQLQAAYGNGMTAKGWSRAGRMWRLCWARKSSGNLFASNFNSRGSRRHKGRAIENRNRSDKFRSCSFE